MKENQKNGTKAMVTSEEFQRIANRVSLVSIIANLVLSIFKLIAGVVAHSNAMISDAVHSASDVFSTIVVIIGIRVSSKESDREHPYGHERLECVAAMILAMILFVTGFGIGINSIRSIVSKEYLNLAIPGSLALVAAIVSIVVKEALFWYTRFFAKKIDSGALMADAWHHRSDALSSIGALIGIAGARMGHPIMDSVASFVIFIFIIKAAYEIFQDAIDKVVDHACDEETEKSIYDFVIKNDEVICIDLLHTRMFGSKIYVDLEIEVDGEYSLQKAHDIAESIHDDIEKEFPQVKHIMVHVNPGEK